MTDGHAAHARDHAGRNHGGGPAQPGGLRDRGRPRAAGALALHGDNERHHQHDQGRQDPPAERRAALREKYLAECLRLGTRQRMTPLIAWRSFAECRLLPSARHSAKYSLPSVFLCRVSGSRQRMFSPCVFLCRV
jgi:hypothetical protein